MNPDVKAFFDPQTFTVSYVVSDPDGRHCAIIDPVLHFDPKSGRTRADSASCIVDYVNDRQLTVDWLLETHAHADHLSAAPYLKEKLGGRIAIGEHISVVQEMLKTLFNSEPEFATDGSQFDQLFKDGDEFRIGRMNVRAMHTPGHTPACITYVIGNAAFVGDTSFMPDYGTARADFPGGDAATLYRSIKKVLSLSAQTRLFMCHDYAPNGREYRWETTVADERAQNIHVHQGITEQDFVKMRSERDKTLEMPNLLLPSVQVNMRAGNLPAAESNGVSYLKLPLNAL